jgi:catechol 2,3-dioxygenase-like lactoylglutathione lyase family enzyme
VVRHSLRFALPRKQNKFYDTMNLQAVDHVAISVRDVERSAQWYIDVLGFERQHDHVWKGFPVFVGRNDAAVAIFPIQRNDNSKASSNPPVRVLHFAFRTNRSGFVAAQQELNERKIPFDFQDHHISHSIYFADPDGHKIEITTYELGSRKLRVDRTARRAGL